MQGDAVRMQWDEDQMQGDAGGCRGMRVDVGGCMGMQVDARGAVGMQGLVVDVGDAGRCSEDAVG